MSRLAPTPFAELARLDELRAAYRSERCIHPGCRRHGPWGYSGRNFCREHRPEDRPPETKPAEPTRVVVQQGSLL